MKGLIELATFLLVATAWCASDWLRRHAEGVLFTSGLAAIGVGFFLIDPPLALIVLGSVVCGLMVLARLLAWVQAMRADTVEGRDA